VIGRAGVVLLYSHFEHYFYTVNDEAVRALNAALVPSNALPELLRLLHSRKVVDALGSTLWERRGPGLTNFARDEAWLWSMGAVGSLQAGRLLSWMTSAMPDQLVRYYKYWGVADIFAKVTRRATSSRRLNLLVKEFVEKRHAIAHGDLSEQATISDVRRYAATTVKFCNRADAVLSRSLGRIVGGPNPW
jgi:hypothetical protein